MASVVRTNSWNDDGSSAPWIESFDATGGDCLYVAINMMKSWGGNVGGITYGGAAMTFLVSDSPLGEFRRIIYYIVAPTTGTNDVNVALTGVGFYPAMTMAACLMTGIDQTTPVRVRVEGTNVSINNLQLTDSASLDSDVCIGLFLSAYTGGPPTDGSGWTPEAGTTEFCDHYRVGTNGTVYTGAVYRVAGGINATVNDTADSNNAFSATMYTFIAVSTGINPGSPLYYRRRRRMAS